MAAGTSIFTLMGEVLVDNTKANESISKTEQKAESLGGKLMKGIGTAAKWGAAIGGAAIVGGAAMFGLANKTAETADFIDKLSERTGINREELQRWKYAADQSGADIGKLEVGVKKLSETMVMASNGSERNVEAFTKLGISMDDLKNKSQEQIFEDTMYALAEMPQGAERNALGNQLLGKSYTELMPLLNAGADGMDELKTRADELGLVMSEEAVVGAVTFGDTMDDLKMSFGAVFTHLGTELIPIFQKLADWVLENMPTIQNVVSVAFEYIGKFVGIVVDIFMDYLLPVFQSIFDWTKENWPTIQTIIEGVFNAIKFVWENVLKPTLNFLWDIIKGIVSWVSDNWGTISKVFETVFNVVKGVWDNILSPVLTALWDVLKGIFDFVTDVFAGVSSVFEDTFDAIGKSVEAVTKIFTGFIDAIRAAWDWLTKWNKTPVEKKDTSISQGTEYDQVDGSHAGGLGRVPFDGYRAILHKDERVLTADENKKYNGKGTNITQNITINTPKYLSPSETARENKKALQRLALQL